MLDFFSATADSMDEELTVDQLLAYIDDEDDTPITPQLVVQYDMGWQKRSSGRKYDSASGVGTMIGQKTGKIIDYGVRSKDCRTCMYWSNRNAAVPEHQCFKNFSGSSRAMEADVAAELVQRIENTADVQVRTLVMDDDSATISRIRGELKHDITKWSDIMHVKKHLKSSLYKLQTRHRILTSDVISYLIDKLFTYALAQNKGDAVGFKKAVSAIVPHVFGHHESCGSWCKHQPGEMYVYKYLPNGRCLVGETLRKDLAAIFDDVAKNADKIAPGGSTSQ